MSVAGTFHTVLLRSDGRALACGKNDHGQCNIPRLEDSAKYLQASAGTSHTALLKSDGTAVACGANNYGQCVIPELEDGVTYTQVSAGEFSTVLLQSDGNVVTCGENSHGECDIPPLEIGQKYLQVSAGRYYTVLLRSDGHAVACGSNFYGQCNIPPLSDDLKYLQVSAAAFHTVLLRSDGHAVACGENKDGQCNIPSLEEGLKYSQVSAGGYYSVLLRDDGRAEAFGKNNFCPCDIPSLDDDLKYIQVSAGGRHTLMLRSDNRAVAFGLNNYGQCNLEGTRDWSETLHLAEQPTFISDTSYMPAFAANLVLQLSLLFLEGSTCHLVGISMAGEERCRVACDRYECIAACVQRQIARQLRVSTACLKVILPDGTLLDSISPSTDIFSTVCGGEIDSSTETQSRDIKTKLDSVPRCPDDETGHRRQMGANNIQQRLALVALAGGFLQGLWTRKRKRCSHRHRTRSEEKATEHKGHGMTRFELSAVSDVLQSLIPCR